MRYRSVLLVTSSKSSLAIARPSRSVWTNHSENLLPESSSYEAIIKIHKYMKKLGMKEVLHIVDHARNTQTRPICLLVGGPSFKLDFHRGGWSSAENITSPRQLLCLPVDCSGRCRCAVGVLFPQNVVASIIGMHLTRRISTSIVLYMPKQAR